MHRGREVPYPRAINQKDEGTSDDRRRDGGTNFILRIKEQETRLTLQEQDDDDDEFMRYSLMIGCVSHHFVLTLSCTLASLKHNLCYLLHFLLFPQK